MTATDVRMAAALAPGVDDAAGIYRAREILRQTFTGNTLLRALDVDPTKTCQRLHP